MTSTTPNQTTETSTPTELLEGVQILIDRMEHFPQDFFQDPQRSQIFNPTTPRFYHIAQSLESLLHGDGGPDPFVHLTSEEKAALLVAYRKMRRQAFTANIIALTFDREEKATSGFARAQAKAEGANVAYYGSSGESLINPWDDGTHTSNLGDRLRAAISKQHER